MRRILIAVLLGGMLLPASARAQIYQPPAAAPSAEQMVNDWYARFLGRQPDIYAAAWVSSLQSGQDPASVLASILSSSEFYMRSGSTPQGYITALFQDLTGQPPRPGQLQSWLNRLYTSNRTDVAYALLQRFPAGWQNGATTAYYPGTTTVPPPPAQTQPVVPVAPYVPYDYRYQYRHHHNRDWYRR